MTAGSPPNGEPQPVVPCKYETVADGSLVNTDAPRAGAFPRKATAVRLEQPAKARSAMLVTLMGIVTRIRLV